MQLVRIITILLIALLSSAGVQAQTAATPKKADAKKAESAKTAPAPAGAVVDINHATAAELKTLPGIGEAYSAAIMKNRPYKNKTQLRSRNVIPPATYDKIKDQIIARQ